MDIFFFYSSWKQKLQRWENFTQIPPFLRLEESDILSNLIGPSGETPPPPPPPPSPPLPPPPPPLSFHTHLSPCPTALKSPLWSYSGGISLPLLLMEPVIGLCTPQINLHSLVSPLDKLQSRHINSLCRHTLQIYFHFLYRIVDTHSAIIYNLSSHTADRFEVSCYTQ